MSGPIVTADDFQQRIAEVRAEVERGIVAAQKEIVAWVYGYWTQEKTTWSARNPNDIWTGQYRASIDVNIGSPSTWFEPMHPEAASGEIEWPTPPANPYEAAPVGDMTARLANLTPYRVVYISDAAPHAQKVENHAFPLQITYAAAEAYFKAFSWQQVVTDQSPPF